MSETSITSPFLAFAYSLASDGRENKVITPGYIGLSPASPYGKSVVTTPQNFLDGRTRGISQGRVIGGGSVTNGMCWTRGSAADFDGWEELGNPGWGWNSLLPYFKKVKRAGHRQANDLLIHDAGRGVHDKCRPECPRPLQHQPGHVVSWNRRAN